MSSLSDRAAIAQQTRAAGAWSRATAIARALLHMPDYERYLAHLADHHPEATPLTRAEFFAQHQAARYARGTSRCC